MRSIVETNYRDRVFHIEDLVKTEMSDEYWWLRTLIGKDSVTSTYHMPEIMDVEHET